MIDGGYSATTRFAKNICAARWKFQRHDKSEKVNRGDVPTRPPAEQAFTQAVEEDLDNRVLTVDDTAAAAAARIAAECVPELHFDATFTPMVAVL